ncbi:MAG TPA: ATP-dependent Clp protease proteolytic subunit [Acidimicrobiales bacterium]|nr:ATP-dependent Clp protease proteolytic subunit [Acidimicrobiales bacterium]
MSWQPPGPFPVGANQETDWGAAVRDRLFAHRTVLLRGALDDATATRVAAELMTLDATGDTRVTLHVDAWGGTLEAAFAVMDVIDLLGVPVHVLCTGRAEGAAVGIVAVAERRACTPHARFLLRDAEATMRGSAADLARWAEHHLRQVRRFHERVAAAVRRPVEEVAADHAAGRYLTAEEALAYGLVDEVASARATVYPLPGRSVGFRP